MNDKNELINHYEELNIGIDEPFTFHCTQCGKCCIHRDDILLTPRDLFRIAQKLQETPAVITKNYCEHYIGHDSRFPIVRLKPRGNVQRCPLLKDRKCTVHDVKPAVCAMFPIGRVFKDTSGEHKTATGTMPKMEYIFINPGCGDDAEQHTVREWLGSFQIPLQDAFFLKWSEMTITLSKCMRDIEKRLSEETMNMVWSILFNCIYLNYDIKEDFEFQFEANRKKVLELSQTLKNISKKSPD